jgi:hypothetical protein
MEVELHTGVKMAQPRKSEHPMLRAVSPATFPEKSAMTKSRLLGAAAMLAAVIATPAMAQQALQEPGAYRAAHPWANDYHYGRSGFWPGDVAADVIGGAIGTADAIVTAPFRGGYRYGHDSYDYYDGGRPYDDSYAYYGTRRGYSRTTCGVQPYATYLGPDGRWYPC